jgi:hypothetical protein
VGDRLATGDVDGFLGEMAGYARLGIEDVIVMAPGDRPDAWIEDICGEAVPRLARLTSVA